MVYKKGVLRNFIKFTGKLLCKILSFNKVAGLRLATLLKNTLAHVVSCEFCEIPKNTFFTEHFRTTASVSGLRLATLLKNTLAHVVSCEFCEIPKNTFFTEHFRTTASVFLIEHLWWLLLFVNLMDI